MVLNDVEIVQVKTDSCPIHIFAIMETYLKHALTVIHGHLKPFQDNVYGFYHCFIMTFEYYS